MLHFTFRRKNYLSAVCFSSKTFVFTFSPDDVAHQSRPLALFFVIDAVAVVADLVELILELSAQTAHMDLDCIENVYAVARVAHTCSKTYNIVIIITGFF